MKNKIKFIITWNFTSNDRSENVYSYFSIVDTRSGRILMGKDVPESNLRGAAFWINGGEHKQNYCFISRQISWREFVNRTNNIEYIGCDSETIASGFKTMMKSRSPKVQMWGQM